MNTIVEKAEKLTEYIDFERVVEFVKKQPLEGYVSKDSLEHLKKKDTQIIYDEKERWSKHFKTQLELLKNSRNPFAEIERELNRIANFIVRNEESILKINNGDWFFNFALLGDIWAEAEALKLYKDGLLKIQNRNQPQQTQRTSFDWKGTPEQLEKLYKQLKSKEHKFVAPQTNYKDFEKVFNGIEVKDIKNRIKWINKPLTNKTTSINMATLFELFYLLKGKFLPETNFDCNQHNKNNFYRKLKHCFETSIGEDLKDLRNKNTYQIKGNTAKAKELANIVAALETP